MHMLRWAEMDGRRASIGVIARPAQQVPHFICSALLRATQNTYTHRSQSSSLSCIADTADCVNTAAQYATQPRCARAAARARRFSAAANLAAREKTRRLLFFVALGRTRPLLLGLKRSVVTGLPTYMLVQRQQQPRFGYRARFASARSPAVLRQQCRRRLLRTVAMAPQAVPMSRFEADTNMADVYSKLVERLEVRGRACVRGERLKKQKCRSRLLLLLLLMLLSSSCAQLGPPRPLPQSPMNTDRPQAAQQAADAGGEGAPMHTFRVSERQPAAAAVSKSQ